MKAIRMRDVSNLLLIVALALLPIYTGSSGGIQLSHALLAIYFGGFILLNGLTFRSIETVLLFLFSFILIRESFAIFGGDNIRALMPAIYLLFNLLLVNAIRRVGLREDGIKALKTGIFLTTAIAVIGVIIIGYGLRIDDEGGRSVGTFNNPNQLGYFSVCLMSIFLLLRLSNQLSLIYLIVAISISLFLAVASLSKAAMVSVAFAGIFSGFTLSKHRMIFSVGIGLLFILVIGGYYLYDSGYLDGYSFIRRLEGIGQQSDDSLEGRGYSVILTGSALEIVFGLGTLKVRDLVGHEIHSTIFNFFGNYGIVGGILFCTVLLLWSRRVYQGLGINGLLMVVVPPMAYGLTHNGSRFTIFWILVSISLAFCKKIQVGDRYNPSFIPSRHASYSPDRALRGNIK